MEFKNTNTMKDLLCNMSRTRPESNEGPVFGRTVSGDSIVLHYLTITTTQRFDYEN